MESNHHSDQLINEPNADVPKMATEHSTSSKLEPIDPFLSLPLDVLANIIVKMYIAQWPSLEGLATNFQSATWNAWRQLRCVHVEREFSTKHENTIDRSSFCASIDSLLQKLVERSPFLTSMHGINLRLINAELNSGIIQSLGQFEHLLSICLGDTKGFTFRRRGVRLENVIEFLESTRSRTCLKELHLFNVVQRPDDRAAILDRFANSFVRGREIQSPLKLEKFSFTSSDDSLFIRLDTMDTARLTDLDLGQARIEPQHLTSLIELASNLVRIKISFLFCYRACTGPRLEANKKILLALASRAKLASMKFDHLHHNAECECTDFGREFIDMLETIGRRGQLRTLAMEYFFARLSAHDMYNTCATIRDYIPYLQSIELPVDRISDGSISDIVSLAMLEEIRFTECWQIPETGNAIRKFAQLSRLKRLAVDLFYNVDTNAPESLADVASLTDLRIRYIRLMSVDILEKWSERLAPNLQILMLGRIGMEDAMYEEGLVRLLEKAARLRVLILGGCVTDRSLKAIAKSCSELETLGVRTTANEITAQCLQEVADRCPKLKRLGGIEDRIRNQLRFQKYQKIGHVDMEFWNYDFDDDEYDC